MRRRANLSGDLSYVRHADDLKGLDINEVSDPFVFWAGFQYYFSIAFRTLLNFLAQTVFSFSKTIAFENWTEKSSGRGRLWIDFNYSMTQLLNDRFFFRRSALIYLMTDDSVIND